MTVPSFFRLYRLLARHRKLAGERNPMFAINRKGKLVGSILFAFLILYSLVMVILFAWIAIRTRSYTTVELLFCALPFFFAADFLQRLSLQQTPSQIITPYLLLPLPRQAVVDAYLLRLLLHDTVSWFWLALVAAYCYMAVFFRFGLPCTLSCLLFFFLSIKLSSLLYTLSRTLASRNILWWSLPVLVAAAMIAPIFIFDSFKAYLLLGDALTETPLTVLLCLLAVLLPVFLLNRRVQTLAMTGEAARTTTKKLRTVSQFRFLDRYGEIGQYLRLEIKSLMRNKNPRRNFLTGITSVLIISLLTTFTTAYDNEIMTNYWGFYCFLMLGMALLNRAMCYEANYIDFLMVHHENLLQLITAKYYFCVALLAFPFLLLLPTVLMGKWSLLMLLAFATFTAGPLYCAMMQMVVYNRERADFNEKLIGKNSLQFNWSQLFITLGAFVVPVFLVQCMSAVIGQTPTYLVTTFVGLAFIAAHRLWLRNIYRRFMRVRYRRIEDYHQ